TQGLLHAVVSHMPQASTFEVRTATAVAAVRSTDWFLEAKPNVTRLGVVTGRVAFTSNATAKKVVMKSGWGTKIEAGKDPSKPHLWAREEFVEYTQQTAVP
ncbi:MAG: hypothetical protein HQL37_08155, partial [Alphaproteobacteria bacterium]|nr:hypothetical protein [Alphaproteobacteria bacterium]